ncbi:MAG: hypothetical protein H7255_11480 [Ramlibacter sp.]|nr:hypothetical protein [Ramlibacter sp.]
MPYFQVEAATPGTLWRLRRLSTGQRAVQVHSAPDLEGPALTNSRVAGINVGEPLLAISPADDTVAPAKSRRGSIAEFAKAAMHDFMESLKRPGDAERYLLEAKLQQLATAVREEAARLARSGDCDRRALQVLITQFESVESQLAHRPAHSAQAIPINPRARG